MQHFFRSLKPKNIFDTASLDLEFGKTKSLVDTVSGKTLISFARTTSATYFDASGVMRTTPVNLLARSEEIGTSPWGLAAATVSADVVNSPAGTLTADKLVESATTAEHLLYQTRTGSLETVTFSIYAKAGERTRLRIGFSNFLNEVSGTILDLSNGTVVSTSPSGTDYTSPVASIVSVGDGWYRCIFTVTKGNANTSNNPFVEPAVGTNYNYAGDGTSGLYLWGAQCEIGSSATSYIPTASTASGAPRFDHDPVTGESLGLLVEEQRTNSIRNNTMVGAVAGTPGTLPTNWTVVGFSGLTRQIVDIGTFQGVNYVDIRFSGTATGTFGNISLEGQTVIAAANNQAWTGSAWIQVIGGSTLGVTAILLSANQFTSSGAYIAETSNGAISFPVSTTFRRISRPLTTNQATTAYLTPLFQIGFTNGAAIDITLRIGLPQLELGAFATSVIPTSTSAATRSADAASITGTNFSNWYNANEGTIFVDAIGRMDNSLSGNRAIVSVSDNTYSNCMFISKESSTSEWRNEIYSLAVVQSTHIFSAYVQGSIARIALAYGTNSANSSANGSIGAVDTSVIVPTVNKLEMRDPTGASAGHPNCHIRRLTYWPRRLQDTTLQKVTR